MGAQEWGIVVLVVGARLLLPLTIPYVPIAGVLACLILDAIDQSIFQQFPGIPLDGYQSYDKALDIYYLTITYLATFRNWTNEPAFRVSQFLFYYRLVGVVAFELSQVRALLFLFPNTFEYFFIFYELVRTRWDTVRLSRRLAIAAAALIWVFIKLPQEWWIHIAQLDMTDFIKETLLGATADTPWSTAIAGAPLVVGAVVVLAALLAALVYWYVTRKAPPADHGFRIKADPLPQALQGADLYRLVRGRSPLFDWSLAEKVALTSLVTTIFVSILPGLEAGVLQVTVVVGLFVVLNTGVSHWMARRGRGWRTVAREFATMMVVNFGLVMGLAVVERSLDLGLHRLSLGATLFFVFLLTLIIVMFDRFRTVRLARAFARGAPVPEALLADPATA